MTTKQLDSETKLRPIAAAFELTTGNRPSPPTIWRWKKFGCKGIKLPFTQVGGVPMISLQDAKKWLEDVTAATVKRAQSPSPTKLSRRQQDAANRLAQEVG
jgi:Protein of unknown function (DUF1580)